MLLSDTDEDRARAVPVDPLSSAAGKAGSRTFIPKIPGLGVSAVYRTDLDDTVIHAFAVPGLEWICDQITVRCRAQKPRAGSNGCGAALVKK